MTKAPEYKQPATAATAAPKTAKMLIFLPNGKRRLLTITLPKESCTLAAVFKEHNIPYEEDTHIQCMHNRGGAIDYFVSVGSTMKIEDMLRNHPVLRRRVGRKDKKSQSTKTTEADK